MPPGWTIISDSGTDTERVASLTDIIIQPLTSLHDSFLRDTPHFLDLLSDTRVDEDDLLVTIDVQALYTNVDNDMALDALEKVWLKHQNIIILIRIIQKLKITV